MMKYMSELEMKELWEKALAEGMKRAEAKYEKHGDYDACGFAWVVIKPGTSRFARWLSKNDLASKHYYGGVSIWCTFHGTQSVGLREEVARGIADVLTEAGIKAYVGSRLD